MNSFISKFIKKFRQKGECPEKEQCLEILDLVLDGEASEEQKQYFKTHIAKCMPCNEGYTVEKAIKTLLQEKCSKAPVPTDLVESIKTKIGHVQ